MDQNTFSRRNFIAAGSILTAASVVPAFSASAQTPDKSQYSGMLNVKDFGAKGDGTSDDTSLIQKALDVAAKTHGSVFIPEGNYLCSELRVPAGVGIHGLPSWSYRDGTGTVLILKDANSRCLINISGAYGAYLFGLCLKGNNLGKEIHGIMVDKPLDYGKQEDTPRIDTCRVEYFSGDGIRLERIWCFVIRHSHCFCNQGCGLRIRGWDGFILDNWFSGNGKAGIAAYDENASNTITGNRIEWNKEGGIVIHGGAQYNITGNYIDRSGHCGLQLLKGTQRGCHTMAVTGNVIFRSGKPEWGRNDEYDSAHVRIEDAQGIVFTGNALNSGRDDGAGLYSPDYGIVVKNLESSIVKDNVQHLGALKQLVVDLGQHGESVIIQDNVGTLRKL